MKPLFASWFPAMVSEQPVSASEDTRALRRLTGLAMLHGAFDDEEKTEEQEQGRRDTAVAGLGRDMEVGEEVVGARLPRSLTASMSISTSTSTNISSSRQSS